MSPVMSMLSGLALPRSSGRTYLKLGWTCVASSSNGSILYAGAVNSGGGEVWKSVDYGVTWNPVMWFAAGINRIVCSYDGTYVTVVTAAIATVNYLISSQDGGASWNTIITSVANKQIVDLSMSSSGQKQVCALNNAKPYISTNYGVSYTQNTTITAASGSGGAGCFYALDGSRVHVSKINSDFVTYTTYYSINDGTSWTLLANSTNEYIQPQSSITNASTLFRRLAGTSNQAYWKSTNSGSTWTSFNTVAGMSSGAIYSETILSDLTGTKLIVFGEKNATGGSTFNTISTDSGTTWSAVRSYSAYGSVGTKIAKAGSTDLVNLVSANTMTAVTADGGSVWTSSDSGATWTRRL